MGDLKRQIKFLEEKNNEYMQNNLDLEDELGKVSKKKPQIEIYKKQINELNTKLSSEGDKADKLAFEHAKLVEKLDTLTIERDRIAREKNALKELNEELKMTAEVKQKLDLNFLNKMNIKYSCTSCFIVMHTEMKS